MASLKERFYFWRREPEENIIREKLMTEAMVLSTQLPQTGCHSGLISIETRAAPSKLLDILCINGQGCLELGLQAVDPKNIIASVRAEGVSVYVQIMNGFAITSSDGLPDKGGARWLGSF